MARKMFTLTSQIDNKEAINVDTDGFTTISKLILIDSKDGSKWDISINGGELLVEPHGKSEKRDFRINKII
jgi:hypothetical protein